jgi:hypothetical protein
MSPERGRIPYKLESRTIIGDTIYFFLGGAGIHFVGRVLFFLVIKEEY